MQVCELQAVQAPAQLATRGLAAGTLLYCEYFHWLSSERECLQSRWKWLQWRVSKVPPPSLFCKCPHPPSPPTWKQDWECRKLTHSILRQTRHNFYCFRWGLYLKNFKNSDKIIITTSQEKHLTSLRNNNHCIGISIQTTRIFTNSTGCFYNYLEYSCKIWHSFYKRRFCHT